MSALRTTSRCASPRPKDRGGASPGIASLDRVEAIVRNPAIYELASLVPAHTHPVGRPRDYPAFMVLVFEALISVFGSARQVEAELANRVVWKAMRRTLRRAFPDDPDRRLPPRPMRRHHYLYLRNRYLTVPDALARLGKAHRELAVCQARQLGLLDPDGPGSWTHPDLTRLLYADGKVITPLFNGRLGDTRIDPNTRAPHQVRYEPDASVHFEGGGSKAFGTKFVLVAARSAETRGRIILDVDWVPGRHQEASVAMDCFARLAPMVPGAQGVIYDSALRGVHLQVLLRDLGLMPITRARASGSGQTRNTGSGSKKIVHAEERHLQLDDGSVRVLRLGVREGALGIEDPSGDGDGFSELRRLRTLRRQDRSGHFRWYNELALPAGYEGRSIMVRLHADADDIARRFNRAEHVRAIPPCDPDFKRLYDRRSDAESINRGLEDTLYLNRAHSVGHARQLLNLLGYALMVNSQALHQHRARALPLAA